MAKIPIGRIPSAGVTAEDFAKRLAKNLLLDFKALEGFSNAQVSDVHPIYAPTGQTVAYYEVKFSSPAKRDNGYAIISATENDYPVAEFSHRGLTHYERLQKLSGRRDFRMIRFGPTYITAEDTGGRLLAEAGGRPIIVPPALQARVHGEAKTEKGLIEPLKAKMDASRLIKDVKLDYPSFKSTYRPPVESVATLREAWTEVRKPEPVPCSFEYFWADGMQNHPFYLQIRPNTPPNNTSHWSGAGSTAWMNLFGYHDKNWTPNLLRGDHMLNDPYINQETMALHDYLRGSVFIMPQYMFDALVFARSRYDHACDAWGRWDWPPNGLLAPSVFELAGEYARKRRPFVVGWGEGSCVNYGLGLGTCECRTHGWRKHSYALIYPAWSPNDDSNFWVPLRMFFAVYGVDQFVRVKSLKI